MLEITVLEITVLAIISLCMLSILWFTLKTGISPMPSSAKARRTILDASEHAAEGTIIDLGSGWGTLLFALARRYPEHQVIGYELSWLPWAYSQLYKTLFRLPNISLYRLNFLDADLPPHSLLVCYLFSKGMHDLKKKLSHDHANALLISNTFALSDTTPMQIIHLDDLYRTPIYVYRF